MDKPETKQPLTITVAGGGNAGHVLLGLLGSGKYKVRMWDVRHPDRWAEDVPVTLHFKDEHIVDMRGTAERFSACAEEVVPGSDVLILAVPAFAHDAYLREAAPYITEGMMIGCMVAEGGFDWGIRDALGKELFAKVTTFAMDTLAWACRYQEYGRKAVVLGTKEHNMVSVSPLAAAGRVTAFLNEALSTPGHHGRREPVFRPTGCYLAATLSNGNAIVHPAIMWSAFKDWDGVTPFQEAPLFYEGVQSAATDLMMEMSCENMAVKAAVLKKMPNLDLSAVMPIDQFFFSLYPDDIADKSSFTRGLVTNAAYRGIRHKMKEKDGGFVPDFQARYLTEDIPFGLVTIKGIAEVVGVETPAINRVMEWCQERIGKKYLVNGRLAGPDVGECRCPQRFGFHTTEEMVTL